MFFPFIVRPVSSSLLAKAGVWGFFWVAWNAHGEFASAVSTNTAVLSG